jgi:hypothetical protein
MGVTESLLLLTIRVLERLKVAGFPPSPRGRPGRRSGLLGGRIFCSASPGAADRAKSLSTITVLDGDSPRPANSYTSVCSEIFRASSTSTPRYLTVLSNLWTSGHRLETTALYSQVATRTLREVTSPLELLTLEAQRSA